MKQIPNILSGLRLIMIGIFVYFFAADNYENALIVYATAVFTDILDGFLARKFNWITNVGKVLDPLADKLMLITVLLCFYLEGWLPLFLFIIVAAKETLMIAGGAFLWKKNIVVYSDKFGKTVTILFNLGIAATLFSNFWGWIEPWNMVILLVAAAVALGAMVHYAKKNAILKKISCKSKSVVDKSRDTV